MSLPNLTLTELQRLEGQRAETVDTLQVYHDAFQRFYQQTARPVWVFLFRRTGDEQLIRDVGCDPIERDTLYNRVGNKRAVQSEV